MPTNKGPSSLGNTLLGLGSGQDPVCAPPPGNSGPFPGALSTAPRLRGFTTIREPPSQAVSQATAGAAVSLSSKTPVAIAAWGTGPFRGVEPMLVAATNGNAAFSAGDPNFAARSLALKKEEKKKEAEKDSGTKQRGERESVQSVPLPHTSSSRLSRARGQARDPSPETLGARALRGVGPSRVAAALGAGQPLAVQPPQSQPRCDLLAGISKRCSAGPRARRGGSGLAPQASIGGFPWPPHHAAGRVSHRWLRSPLVPAGAPGEGAPRSPCCEGPGPRLWPLGRP